MDMTFQIHTKHPRNMSHTKHVSKYNHKELQNTFQNCTQFKSQSQIEGQTILEWKRDKKPNQAKQ
jgi:hypothetical protein